MSERNGEGSGRQIRITGATRAGIRVFSAMEVPFSLRADERCSRFQTERAKALAAFHKKHPGSRVLEVRLMSYSYRTEAW